MSIHLPNKQTVLGVDVSTTSYDEVALVCKNWIQEKRDYEENLLSNPAALPGHYICVTSVHGIMVANEVSVVKEALNKADIVTPDGMPVVWALRSFGARDQSRVYGPELMLRLCAQAAHENHRIYLHGGSPDTLVELERRLTARFPDLAIAGAYSPPFRELTDEECKQSLARIVTSEADFVFIGISTPKQDLWMAANSPKLPGVIMVGVGAAFDFHAGRVKQAPRWVQGAGLEWLFRLLTEPKRLWKRYLLTTPIFLPLWALQRLGFRKYPNSSNPLTSEQK